MIDLNNEDNIVMAANDIVNPITGTVIHRGGHPITLDQMYDYATAYGIEIFDLVDRFGKFHKCGISE